MIMWVKKKPIGKRKGSKKGGKEGKIYKGETRNQPGGVI